MMLKIRNFVIFFIIINFAKLQTSFGEYASSNLKGYEFSYDDILLPNKNLKNLASDVVPGWLDTLKTSGNYGSEALVRQIHTKSRMMDSKGDIYGVSFRCIIEGKGIGFDISRPRVSSTYYPWYLLDNSINCSKEPYLDGNPTDKNLFKNCFHNAIQACIAQEVGNYSNYLYVFFYIPPTRFMNTKKNDVEGILMLKLTKSSIDTRVVEQKFYPGTDNAACRFDHLRPRRDDDNYAFGTECGNFQAWVDTDNNGTDHVHLNWLGLKKENDFSTSKIYQLYVNTGEVTVRNSSECNSGGRCIFPRTIKFDEYIYMIYSWNGLPSIWKTNKNSTNIESVINLTNEKNGIFTYVNHDQAYNAYTAKNYDFCIVENNDGSPIFCVLGLRATDATDNTKTSLSGKNNERWTPKYINETSPVVLILSSFISSDSKINITKSRSIEDPQNIIYSTGKTTDESCSTTCKHYSNTYDGYGEKQLFKNTHKLIAYTSDSGNKYIIYCYCYPGKSKQLFLGYAPYYISNNKVHLLTKTEFAPPPTNNTSIEGFTSCSRILFMDCKNGQLCITWTNADDSKVYSFHIAAKDLIRE